MKQQDIQNLQDGSASAAIVAAIIGAAATAAAAAGQTAAGKPRSVYGVATNLSEQDFDIYSFGPRWGHTFETPDIKIRGAGYVSNKFLEAVKAEYGDDYSSEDLGKEKAKWIRDRIFDSYGEECVVKFGGEGRITTQVFKQLIVFYTPGNSSNLVLAFLYGRTFFGNNYVGFYLGKGDAIDWEGDKPYGKALIKRIENEEQNCRYSNSGAQITMEFENLRVTVPAPGQKMEPKIEAVD